jgi:hypothetical protein
MTRNTSTTPTGRTTSSMNAGSRSSAKKAFAGQSR